MKKLTVLSIMAASFLLVGCGDSATGAEAKAAATQTEAPAAKCAADGKCGEGKCGGDKKSAATEAKEAAAVAVEKTKEAVAQKATEAKEAATAAVSEAKEAVTEKATAAVDAAKESATSAVDSVKAAAASAAATATAAVADVTGPDGKALYAKCVGCHGADAKNKPMGKDAVIAGQSAADLETKLAGYKAGTLNKVGMGALMQGQVASMNDADIKAVAAYMAGL